MAHQPPPEHHTAPLTEASLQTILTYLGDLLLRTFQTTVRIVIHGGAFLVLHKAFSCRQFTRDVDYIHRSFVTEWKARGVYDAGERLVRCIEKTAEKFGLGKDWMNAHADVALPITIDAHGRAHDPIYTSALTPANMYMNTVFSHPGLTLIGVSWAWAVALKLVRYAKDDPSDVAHILSLGARWKGVRWTREIVEEWVRGCCAGVGYERFPEKEMGKVRDRMEDAVRRVQGLMGSMSGATTMGVAPQGQQMVVSAFAGAVIPSASSSTSSLHSLSHSHPHLRSSSRALSSSSSSSSASLSSTCEPQYSLSQSRSRSRSRSQLESHPQSHSQQQSEPRSRSGRSQSRPRSSAASAVRPGLAETPSIPQVHRSPPITYPPGSTSSLSSRPPSLTHMPSNPYMSSSSGSALGLSIPNPPMQTPPIPAPGSMFSFPPGFVPMTITPAPTPPIPASAPSMGMPPMSGLAHQHSLSMNQSQVSLHQQVMHRQHQHHHRHPGQQQSQQPTHQSSGLPHPHSHLPTMQRTSFVF